MQVMSDDLLGADDWDERHRDHTRDRAAHPALTHLADELEPGRCLEIGCGQGTDAVWLATQGWDVTAVDISGVALDMARSAAAERGVTVRWEQADVTDSLPDGPFDLVTTIYPAVPAADGVGAAMVDLVAPGGRFLGVWHGPEYSADARARGFDPDDYLQPDHVLPHLTGWALVVDELRPHGDGEDRLVLARRKTE
jgi:SAM-dependent methyltransferase